MTISVFLVRCNHLKSVTEGSRSRNASCMSRRLWWEGLGFGSVGGELWHCASLGSSRLYSSLFVISLLIISTITIVIVNFISVTKLLLPRLEGKVSEQLCGAQVPAGLNHGTAINFKTFNISMTHLPAKFSEQKPIKPYLAHTNMEDTALQIDILFYLLHRAD